MKDNGKKKYDRSRIEEILVNVTITASDEGSQPRMLEEYEQHKNNGCRVDHYILNPPRKIVMTNSFGAVFEVRE